MSQAHAVDNPKYLVSNQNDRPSMLVQYIRDMLQELHTLAPDEAGVMLPYLIDMAKLEAEEAGKRLQHSTAI